MEKDQKNTVKSQEEEGRERTYQRVRPEGRRRKASEEGNVRRGSEEKIVEEAPLNSNHDNAPEDLPANSQTATERNSTLEPATAHRERTNAFTIGNYDISISSKPGKTTMVGRRGETKRLTRDRQSLTYSSSWNQDLEEQSDEIWRTLGVVTETIGYMLWRSPDYNNKPPWKVGIENGSYYCIYIYFHFWFRYGGNSFHLWMILRLGVLSLCRPTL